MLLVLDDSGGQPDEPSDLPEHAVLIPTATDTENFD